MSDRARRALLSFLAALGAVAGAGRAADTPPVVKQFQETSYTLNDIVLAEANTGWAVGEPHWNQAARGYKGTIIKTTNGGQSWTAQEAGVVESFRAVHFVDANRGWVVGTNGTILATTDGGARWTRQTVATADGFSSVVFTDANNGWAASSRPVHYYDFGEEFDDWLPGIWHTTDGGGTWAAQQLPSGASIVNRVEFVNAQTGWAVGPKLAGYDFGYQPRHLGAIYNTTDGGRTWSAEYLTEAGFTFTAVDFVDALNGWVAGFPHSSRYSGECTFHTTDGGKTWTQQKAGTFNTQVRDIQFIDKNRGYAVGTAYLGDGTAVWRTLDGGTTWTDVRMRKPNILLVTGLWGVAVLGNQVLVVGDLDYLASSTKAWDPCEGTYPQPTCSSCDCLFDQSYINPHYIFHDVHFADETHGWVVGSRTFDVGYWGQVILGTEDGGQTWRTQYEHWGGATTMPRYHRLESVHFVDRLRGWAVGTSQELRDRTPPVHEGAIVSTTDGGRTWKQQGADLEASEFAAVRFTSSTNGWALSTSGTSVKTNTLARTTDGGNRWYWVDTGVPGVTRVGYAIVQGALSFKGDLYGWAGILGKVIRTTDAGATWAVNPLPRDHITCHALDFLSSEVGWAAGLGLHRTRDGGQTWETKDIGVTSDLHDIQFTNATNGWLAGDRGVLMRTPDGGNAWSRVESGTSASLLGLHFVSAGRGWIVGDYGTILSYSDDRVAAGKPAIYSIVNGASYRTGITSSGWMTINGANLAQSTRVWNRGDFNGDKLPVKLDGVRVSVNGKLAYPYYISPSQINALVPGDATVGLVPVEVSTDAGTSNAASPLKADYSPGVFAFSLSAGQYALAHTADGTFIGSYVLAKDVGLTGKMRDAKPGEIITLYGTGFGETVPAMPADSIVGQPAALAAPVTFRFGRTTAEVRGRDWWGRGCTSSTSGFRRSRAVITWSWRRLGGTAARVGR
jgi:uncharacterized protein (TIGR03437 family)